MKKIISIIMIMIILMFVSSSFVFADEVTESMKGWNEKQGMSGLFSVGGSILGVVQVIGVSVSLIMLIVLAIKYMLTSPNEKADIKSKLIPYFTGAILIFGASGLLGIIQSLANTIK